MKRGQIDEGIQKENLGFRYIRGDRSETGGLTESKRVTKDMFSSCCQADFKQSFEMPQNECE